MGEELASEPPSEPAVQVTKEASAIAADNLEDDSDWPSMDDVKEEAVASVTPVVEVAERKLSSPSLAVGPSAPGVNLSSVAAAKPASKLGGGRTSIMGKKKKAGLGKKSGFGAQRVKTDFQRLEETAAADESAAKAAGVMMHKKQQEQVTTEIVIPSARLSMQPASDKKKEAANRLGMASVGSTRAQFSHTTTMQIIQQDDPQNKKSSSYKSKLNKSSRRNRYLSSSSSSGGEDDDFHDAKSSATGITAASSGSRSYMDSVRNEEQRNKSMKSHSHYTSGHQVAGDYTIIRTPTKPATSSKAAPSKGSNGMSGDVKDELSGSKAISSDMLFDRDTPEVEARSRSTKFEHSNAIGSSAFFQQRREASNWTVSIECGVKQHYFDD